MEEEFQDLERVGEGHKLGKRQGFVGIRELEIGDLETRDVRTDINRDKDMGRLVPLDARQIMVARLGLGAQKRFQGLLPT